MLMRFLFCAAEADYETDHYVCMCLEPNPILAVMPKENIGYGAAFGYFYGYLRLVLPGK